MTWSLGGVRLLRVVGLAFVLGFGAGQVVGDVSWWVWAMPAALAAANLVVELVGSRRT